MLGLCATDVKYRPNVGSALWREMNDELLSTRAGNENRSPHSRFTTCPCAFGTMVRFARPSGRCRARTNTLPRVQSLVLLHSARRGWHGATIPALLGTAATHETLHMRVVVAFVRNRHKRTTMNLTFDLPNRCRHPPTKSPRISRAGDGQKGARHGSHPFGSLAIQAARA